jgi:hypothetical protein
MIFTASFCGRLVIAMLIFASVTGNANPGDLPPITVTLKGNEYVAGGEGAMAMVLRLDEKNPSGSVQFGDAEPFHMSSVSLVLIDSSEAAGAVHARYKLHYQINRCEHEKAKGRDAPLNWDACFFQPGGPLPVMLSDGEAWLNRTRTDRDDVVVAAGISDLRDLTGVFRLNGRVAQ